MNIMVIIGISVAAIIAMMVLGRLADGNDAESGGEDDVS